VRFAIAENWFKLPMKVINRTKAVTQCFLKNSFHIKLHTKDFFSKCQSRHGVLRVFVSFCVLVLCGPFCHGALKPDISTLFKTFFL